MTPRLTAEFHDALIDYVARVEAVQGDLLALHRRKRAALTTADAAELRQIAPVEQALADRLAALVEERGQMLNQAERFSLPRGSLVDLAAGVGGGPALLDRIAACRRRASNLRREGWVQWVVAKRSLAQTASLLDLIAHRGRRPVTYGEPRGGGGGALLDASA